MNLARCTAGLTDLPFASSVVYKDIGCGKSRIRTSFLVNLDVDLKLISDAFSKIGLVGKSSPELKFYLHNEKSIEVTVGSNASSEVAGADEYLIEVKYRENGNDEEEKFYKVVKNEKYACIPMNRPLAYYTLRMKGQNSVGLKYDWSLPLEVSTNSGREFTWRIRDATQVSLEIHLQITSPLWDHGRCSVLIIATRDGIGKQRWLVDLVQNMLSLESLLQMWI
jgi:hypothetical protein